MDADSYQACELCPRRCKARRASGRAGFCGMTSELRVARSALHFWEEPPISGEAGSGAIFFRAALCAASSARTTRYPARALACRSRARAFRDDAELEPRAPSTSNLVTAPHYAPDVRQAVLDARAAGLTLPIVCNTSGYENPEVIRAMADVVDVWLPDFKYADPTLAGSLSAAPDYLDVAAAALGAMVADLRRKGGRKEGPRRPP